MAAVDRLTPMTLQSTAAQAERDAAPARKTVQADYFLTLHYSI
ncbi:MAG TPA: peptidylprolyl isomerase, partial [Cupriavidus sp.]|nr:peptidylprolyl isomerase [Cupriavidus sp.]